MAKTYNKTFTILLLVGIMLMACALVLQNVPNNDMWFLISTGRYIVENHTIPDTNPFTWHEGLTMTVQQWVPAVILYLLYHWFGIAGHVALVMGLAALSVFLLYKYVKLFAVKQATHIAVTLMIGITLTMCLTNRPLTFTVPCFIALLYCLEQWKRSHHARWLIAMPFLSVCVINMQAAMWPMLFVFTVPYWFPRSVYNKTECKAAIKSWLRTNVALFVTIAIMFAVGFLNPQGIDNMLYCVRGYSQTVSMSAIGEMRPPVIKDAIGFIIMLGFAALILYAYKYLLPALRDTEAANKYVPLLYLGAGSFILLAMHYRNLIFVFGLAPIISILFDEWLVDWKYPGKKKAIAMCLSALLIPTLFIGYSAAFHNWNNYQDDTNHTPYSVITELDKVEDKDSIILFNEYDNGGFFQWYGYKTYIDPRAEMYTKSLNGKEDIMLEYMKVCSSQIDVHEFVEKYQFTHMMVHTKSLVQLMEREPGYEKVIDGNGYAFFVRTTPRNHS
jgi:hypothetical protein